MFALHARYRGRELRRRHVVDTAVQAFSNLDGIELIDRRGVEDFVLASPEPQPVADICMALLSAGDWALSLVAADTRDDAEARNMATTHLSATARGGSLVVHAFPSTPTTTQSCRDVRAAFSLMQHVVGKRTLEGHEATALMRRGMNQNEAAEELGISKQAMSQRLQAAGWSAETQGWPLCLNLLQRLEQAVATESS